MSSVGTVHIWAQDMSSLRLFVDAALDRMDWKSSLTKLVEPPSLKVPLFYQLPKKPFQPNKLGHKNF